MLYVKKEGDYMLQTTYLYYLVQIKHYQSLSIAAERLHVSQPALSKGIKKLEDQLGAQLINRTYKGISLTKDGEKIVELAEKAFFYLNEIESQYSNKHHALLSKDINLYINPVFSSILLPLLSNEIDIIHFLQIHNLKKDYDATRILLTSNKNIILDIVPEHFTVPSNISMTLLSQSKSYVTYPKDFPYISSMQNSISFHELLNIPLVASRTPLETQNILMTMLKKYGTPNIKITAPDTLSAMAMAKKYNLGFLTLKLFKTTEHENDAMCYLPIRNGPVFKLVLLYDKTFSQNSISYLTEVFNSCIL